MSKHFGLFTVWLPFRKCHTCCSVSHPLCRHRLCPGSYGRWADYYFFQGLKTAFFGLENPRFPHSSVNRSTMAPSTSGVKNSGSVHLSCVAVLSNPRCHGNGPNNLALDLHLLLAGPPAPLDEKPHQEKTILAHYFNAKGFSFENPRVCCINVSVRVPVARSLLNSSNL